MPLAVSLLEQKPETTKIKYIYALFNSQYRSRVQLVKDRNNRVSIQLQIHSTNTAIQFHQITSLADVCLAG